MRDHFRREARQRSQPPGDVDRAAVDVDGPVRMVMRTEAKQRLRRAVAELPYEQREVLMLRVHADVKFREMAEHQNVSLQTALSRYRYGLDKLPARIERHGISLDFDPGRTLVIIHDQFQYYADVPAHLFEPQASRAVTETIVDFDNRTVTVQEHTGSSQPCHPMRNIVFVAGLIFGIVPVALLGLCTLAEALVARRRPKPAPPAF